MGRRERTNGSGSEGEFTVDGSLTPADEELIVGSVREEGDAACGDELELISLDVLNELRGHPWLFFFASEQEKEKESAERRVGRSEGQERTNLTRTAVTSRLPLSTEGNHALSVDEHRVGRPSRDLRRARERVRACEVGHDGGHHRIVLRSESKTPKT